MLGRRSIMVMQGTRRSPRLRALANNAKPDFGDSTTLTKKSNSRKKRAKVSKQPLKSITKPSNESCKTPLLLDISPLVRGKLIKRPSSQIRSPYVADVQILPDGPVVLAHAPALNVGGLCLPGSTVYMSIRNGGKTTHAIELVEDPSQTQRLENENGEEEDGAVLVGAHPRLGESLAEQILKLGLLKDQIGFGPAMDYDLEDDTKKKTSKKSKKSKVDIETEKVESKIYEEEERSNKALLVEEKIHRVYLRKQRTYGNSRVDFELSSGHLPSSLTNTSTSKTSIHKFDISKIGLVEVKNVVCADYSIENAPEKREKNHCVIIAEPDDSDSDTPYLRSGLFPWGLVNQTFENQKVVSARAIKHVRHLADIAKGQTGSKNKPVIQPTILFIVNRSDCVSMRACHEACPMFASELKVASESGVNVIAARIRWSRRGEAFFDSLIDVDL